MEKLRPTSKFYGLFQMIFDYYNEALFDGELKDCIITITRKHNVFGHYTFKQFYSVKEQETDELAINPTMIAQFPLLEVCQTIVHEMCHGWQFHFGKPSVRTYHNKEWSEKMISVGLMPSHNGKPGGKAVGQKMMDYPIENGSFMLATEELMNSNVFENLFLEVNDAFIENIDPDKPLFEQVHHLHLQYVQDKPKNPKKLFKYSCSCSNVWGKPDLELCCNKCSEVMHQIS